MNADEQHIAAICCERGIRLLVLFGSRASGRHRPGSDTDLAVLLDRSPRLPEMVSLQEALEGAVGAKGDVQLVVLNDLQSTTLGREIVRGGRVLYDFDGEQWPAFVCRAMKAYADFEPFRRLRDGVLRGGKVR
jgi:predicted nucleotidyltransferase